MGTKKQKPYNKKKNVHPGEAHSKNKQWLKQRGNKFSNQYSVNRKGRR